MAFSSLRRQLSQFEIKAVDGLDNPDLVIGGAGSYGTAYEVTVDGKQRIAKQLHSSLIAANVRLNQKEALFGRFYKECLLLSGLDHQNVVKFVGVHFGSSKREFDVSLVMEKLYIDLEKYLDQNPNVHIDQKLSILLDISNGLIYLHSQNPPIIHRDLTTPNILLTDDMLAKIADFGVSRALDISPTKLVALTKCPGTLAYMAPEALCENPVYAEPLDIFSFGEICLCVIHQKFAEVFSVTYHQDLSIAQSQGEIEILKRKKWFDDLPPNHCLRQIMTVCLQDHPNKRPNSEKLKELLIEQCLKRWKNSVENHRAQTKELVDDELHKQALERKLDKAIDDKDTAQKEVTEVTSSSRKIKAQAIETGKKLDTALDYAANLSKIIEDQDCVISKLKTESKEKITKLEEELNLTKLELQGLRCERDSKNVQQRQENTVEDHDRKEIQALIRKLEESVTKEQKLGKQMRQAEDDFAHAIEAKSMEIKTLLAEKLDLIEQNQQLKQLQQNDNLSLAYQEKAADYEHQIAMLKEELREKNEIITAQNVSSDGRIEEISAHLNKAKEAQVSQYKKELDSLKMQLKESKSRLVQTQTQYQQCLKTMEKDYHDQIEQATWKAFSDKLIAEAELIQAKRKVGELERQLHPIPLEELSQPIYDETTSYYNTPRTSYDPSAQFSEYEDYQGLLEWKQQYGTYGSNPHQQCSLTSEDCFSLIEPDYHNRYEANYQNRGSGVDLQQGFQQGASFNQKASAHQSSESRTQLLFYQQPQIQQQPIPVPRTRTRPSTEFQPASQGNPPRGRRKHSTDIQESAMSERANQDPNEFSEFIAQEEESIYSEAPFDPYLVCQNCKLNFRVGEIQKYKKHAIACKDHCK